MSHIISEIDGQLGIITLNNPDKHNAFDDVLIADLTHALKAMENSADVRVVTGEERAVEVTRMLGDLQVLANRVCIVVNANSVDDFRPRLSKISQRTLGKYKSTKSVK